MRRLTTLVGLLMAFAGLLPPAAQAELDEIALAQAQVQTFACAQYEQLFEAYDLAFLVPEIRATLFQRLQDRGASEDQAGALSRLYDETRRRLVDAGMQAGSRKADLDKGRLTTLEREADIALNVCGRTRFDLLQIGPEPEEAGLDEKTFYRWKEMARSCGRMQAKIAIMEFETEFPNIRALTFENIRRHGASLAQVSQLENEFKKGEADTNQYAEDLAKDRRTMSDEWLQQTLDRNLEFYLDCVAENYLPNKN